MEEAIIGALGEIFDRPSPLLKMTLSRSGKKYRLEQRLIMTPRADEKYNFARFVESSVVLQD